MVTGLCLYWRMGWGGGWCQWRVKIPLGEGNRKEASVSGWTVTLIWLLRNYVCVVQGVCVLVCLGRVGFVARG